ncbi:MAG: S9 family peptidase [Proteobacteria bacterium]|nr:S9 family peptidase [Pseudomonadota bacterium]
MRRGVLVALIALLACAGAHAGNRVLQPADLFQMHWAGDAQISRDGTQIVYERHTNDVMTDHVVESLWLIDTATGAQLPVTTRQGHFGSPRWSPDGTRIAYLATGADGRTQIVVHWLRGDTAVLTNLTEAPTDITWSPDGKQIAFVMLVPTPRPAIGKPLEKPAGASWGDGPVVIDQLNYRADGFGLDKTGYRHLFVISTDGGGTPRQLTFGPFSEAGPLAWSPDGRGIYFAGNRTEGWNRGPEDWARHTAMTLAIYKVNLADNSLTQLSHEVGPYHSPVVSPDGKQVAYLGYEDKHVGNQSIRLNVMDADGRNARVVSGGLERSITDAQWAADGRSLYVQYIDEGITKVARMGLDGRLEPVADHLADVFGPVQLPYSGGQFSVSAKGTVAYLGGSAEHLPEVFVAQGGKTRRLTNLNGELLSEATIGKLSALPVKSSFDGRPIGAWEVLPPNFDPAKKYPLILEIHGGPYMSYAPVFSAEYQLYAAAGYIVVYGNPRGSTSYGEEFANLIHNNYPSHDFDDLMSIVDAAIARGNVDADNLFVTGSSGGGVLTSWIVGKTHRFRAAVTQRPVVNWTSWMLTADMGAFGARYWFKKLPWEDQETFWKTSPISLIGNVTTPTMVLVGQSDLRTPVAEAEQYYQALQLRGVPTELYEIPGAAHVVIRPSQLAQAQSAIIEWFDRYRTTAKH